MNNISFQTKAKLALKYPKTTLTLIGDTIFPTKNPVFPRMVGFFITNACNLNCSMCLNAKYRKAHIRNSNFTLKNAQKIIYELVKYKPLVWFSGGEPLVNPEMIDIITLFSKNGLCTSMTSNGFILEYYAKRLAHSGLDFLSLSLDSFIPEVHDRGRGVKGSFNRMIKGLSKLKTERLLTGTPINIKINSVVSKNNYTSLSSFYDFIESLDIDEWRLQHLSYVTPQALKIIKRYIKHRKVGEGYTGELIHDTKYFNSKQINVLADQFSQIKRKAKYYKTKFTIDPYVDDLYSYYQGTWPNKESRCKPAFDQMTIYENGKVGAGCLAWKIGSLEENKTLKEIWTSKRARYFRNLIQKNNNIPPCFRCCSLNYNFE